MNTSIGSTAAKYFMEGSCQLLESFFNFTFDCGTISLNLPTCVASTAICQQEKPGSQVSSKVGGLSSFYSSLSHRTNFTGIVTHHLINKFAVFHHDDGGYSSDSEASSSALI